MIDTKRIVIVVIFFFALIQISCHSEKDAKLHLALVAPLTGESSGCGNAYLNGVRMYLEKFNQQCGEKTVILDIYDDQNKRHLAEQKAKEIVQDHRALGVIGHHYSSCSIAGGNVYKENHIPAITPTSTNINVTLNNPWYFRVTFHDNYQARFLANYAVRIIQKTHCVLICETQTYGSYISDIFEKSMIKLDGSIDKKYVFNAQKSDIEIQLKNIVNDLQQNISSEKSAFIFISSHVPEGLELIKLIRDANLHHSILLPDTFAGGTFTQKITNLPAEKNNPGFYTNRIYVASPFIYDIANQSAQVFKQNYFEKFNESPDWRAAFAYDAARLLVHAIKEADISGKKPLLEQERQSIRDYLLSTNTPKKGIDGLTGLTFFDNNGDAAKPLSIATFYQQNLVSAFTQLKVVNKPYTKTEIQKKMADGTIVLVDDQYMFQTNIIYTGIHINTIQDINLSDQIHVLDFYIWFKYRGDINASDIIFLNAVKPLGLGKPIETEYSNGEHYEMYHVKGQFMCNAIDMSVDAGNNILGFSFRHAKKPEYNIVYVSDINVMNANNNDRLLQDINQSSPAISTKYSARKLYYFSDVTYKKAFGKPGYLSESINGGVEFSRYNFFVHINEKKVSFRRITWNFYINLLMTIMSIMSLFLTASVLKSFAVKYPRLTWGVQLFMGYVLLISSEPLLLVFQVDESRLSYFEFIKLAYDIFWWLVPASFINLAIKRFIWIPLENKTGRRIPKIVTNSVIFLIYLMTFFGIVAYVFDQKLTSLLATSGVLAMIIGLAIQVNIANVFSGIVINIEQPFRIGDWIEIDHKFKGKVVDITWRTTRILTHSGNILSFPNSYTSESPINNYCYPDRNVWIKIIIHINPTYSPEKIKKICMDAMLSIDGLVKELRPIIRYQLTDWCADYTLLFCINDYSKKIQFKSELYERIWIHLNRIGIEPAIKRQEVHMFRGTKDRGEEALNPLSILSEIDIFKGFSDELRKQLSQKMHQHQYHTEEYIIKQGDEGDSLFIIIEGSVSVQILIDGKHVEVDRMGAGTFFGEMALLTGEPRNASIVAITNCVLYEITKCDIAPLFTHYPEITEILSKELTRRAVNRQQKKEHYDQERIDKDALKNSFFSKISNYFGINKNVREIDRECVDTDFSI